MPGRRNCDMKTDIYKNLLLSILFRGCISQPGLVVPDESVANEIGKLEPN